jgi:ectoine hydroxylase-related dioxygenase (phytanoyl-CoA dioxygenase family)
MPLTEKQMRAFNDIGFTVVKGLFSPDEMVEISAWADGLRDKQPSPGEEAKYYEVSPITGDNLLVRIENVIGDHNRAVSDMLISDKTKECLAQLLGEPPVLFKEKINYKLPGCRADKLHQDQAAGWNAYGKFYITMAIAVDENRLENGALSFMCSGNYEKVLMSEEWKPLTEDDPSYLPADEYVLLEADPGDVIFFDAFVPHGSPANTGTRSRRNIFLTFNRESDGDKRARYYRDKWANYPPNQEGEARKDRSFRV